MTKQKFDRRNTKVEINDLVFMNNMDDATAFRVVDIGKPKTGFENTLLVVDNSAPETKEQVIHTSMIAQIAKEHYQ